MNFLNIGGGEFLVLVLLLLIFFGPEDIARIMRKVGQYTRSALRTWAQVSAALRGDLLPEEISEVVDDVKTSVKEVEETVKEVSREVDDTMKEISEEVDEAAKEVDKVAEEVDEVAKTVNEEILVPMPKKSELLAPSPVRSSAVTPRASAEVLPVRRRSVRFPTSAAALQREGEVLEPLRGSARAQRRMLTPYPKTKRLTGRQRFPMSMAAADTAERRIGGRSQMPRLASLAPNVTSSALGDEV